MNVQSWCILPAGWAPTLASPAVMFCRAPMAASRLVELLSLLCRTSLYSATTLGCHSHSAPCGCRDTSDSMDTLSLRCHGNGKRERTVTVYSLSWLPAQTKLWFSVLDSIYHKVVPCVGILLQRHLFLHMEAFKGMGRKDSHTMDTPILELWTRTNTTEVWAAVQQGFFKMT